MKIKKKYICMVQLVILFSVFFCFGEPASAESIDSANYAIKSYYNQKNAWDIESGVGVNRQIISYQYNFQVNQQWQIMFKENDNGYLITNETQPNLIVTQYANNLYTRLNNTSYSEHYSEKALYDITIIDWTTDTVPLPIVMIHGKGDAANLFYTVIGNRVGVKEYNGDLGDLASIPYAMKWILVKTGELPTSTISNVEITGTSIIGGNKYYVGQELNVSGTFKPAWAQLKTFDVYSQINNSEASLVSSDNVINTTGSTDFENTLDTSNFTEGTYPISIFSRADSLFLSNTYVSKNYTFIYPTPTGEAVPQDIELGTPLENLNPASFVKNLKDEIGSEVVAEKIEGIDTNKVGSQTAKVTIKNKYKSVVIDVPVIVGGPPQLSWSNQTKVETKNSIISEEDEQLKETLYWKSDFSAQQYKLVLKNDGKKISEQSTTVSGSIDTWIEEKINIPVSSLSIGKNQLTVEIYNLDGSGEAMGTISLEVIVSGSLKLISVPSELSWTNLSSRYTKGILSRDTGNSITIVVQDTRSIDESQKNWSVRAKSEVLTNEVPFDLFWKNTPNDLGSNLNTEQIILTKDQATKQDNFNYEKEWDVTAGVVLSSPNYLKVGDYSGQMVVEWTLYDTLQAN